ncbi:MULTISPECIES: hypothetical protein [Proteus]|uniref:Phage protein n=1 Tax=Proteus appendicitidis TaxID=3034648 RepID=A0ABY8YC49_9GAMM|nr:MULTISPECIES: hypothetical protein [unclassified Proteus (in: enterobacteria)]WIV89788.1 hypothetical protein QQS39_07215 [Proteus sp. HZ0627]
MSNSTEQITNTLSVIIKELPKILVSTSFSWETVISSFFAALIPSFIAWYALKNNYRLAEYQNTLKAKDEWVMEFRNTLAGFVTDSTILIANIELNCELRRGSCIGSIKRSYESERDVEFGVQKLLLLLSKHDEYEAKFSTFVINVNNLIQELKKYARLDADLVDCLDRLLVKQLRIELRNIMIESREVIIAKYKRD